MIEKEKFVICFLRDINPWGFKHLLETLSSKYNIKLFVFNSINKSDEIFLKNLEIDFKIISTKGFIYKLEHYLKILIKTPKTNNYKYGIERDILSIRGFKKWYFYLLHLILPKILSSNFSAKTLSYFKTDLDNVFKNINPEFVLSYAFLNPIYPIIRAHKLGYKTYVIVYSWDNPYKYSFLPNCFDKYFIWNKAMSSDLSAIHKISNQKQLIIGAMQFEYLRKTQINVFVNNSIISFARDNCRKYYLYLFSLGYNGSSQEIKLLEHLSVIILAIDPEAIIIARPYPNANNIEEYNTIRNLQNVILDDSVIRGLFQDDMTMYTKQCLLFNAKAVINLATTMGLEASFYKIPIIQINYIPNNIEFNIRGKERVFDMDYLLKNDHLNKYLFLNGYMNVVKSDEDFINVVNEIRNGNIEQFEPYSNHLRSLADPVINSSSDLFLKNI